MKKEDSNAVSSCFHIPQPDCSSLNCSRSKHKLLTACGTLLSRRFADLLQIVYNCSVSLFRLFSADTNLFEQQTR